MVAVMMLSAALLVQEKPRLDALVVNSAGAPAAVVAAARMTADAIFQRAGIDIDWFDRESIARRNRSPRSMYVVRIVPAAALPSNAFGDRLGFAVIGSRIASVLYPAVESLAERTDSETGVLLGPYWRTSSVTCCSAAVRTPFVA